MTSSQKKILVTGSAGFVGSSLVTHLKQQGHFVIGIDVKPDSVSSVFIQKDIYDVHVGDIPSFDLCIHLASRVGGFLHNYYNQTLVDYELGLLKKIKTICQHYQKNCERILYTSSINVFEQSQIYPTGPLIEHNQQTPYAQAKAAGEKFVAKNFKEFVILRPTNIFGATQLYPQTAEPGRSHVIPEILRKIDLNPIVEILGDGTQTRNFIHVEDVCRLILMLLNTPTQAWFNVRSHLQLTIEELALELLRFKNVKKELRYHPEFLKYEPLPLKNFDLTPLLNLGWKPLINSIQEGLRVI